MNTKQYFVPLFSAAVAAVMTVSTFGSLSSYVDHSAQLNQAPFAETIASRQIDSGLQLALQQNQSEVHDNIATEAVVLMPKFNTEAPAMLIAQR